MKTCKHGKIGCLTCDEKALVIGGVCYRNDDGFWYAHPGTCTGDGMGKALDFIWECLEVLDNICYMAADDDEMRQMAREFLEEHALDS